MKMLVVLISLVFCVNGFAQGLKIKGEKELHPGQTIKGEGKSLHKSAPTAKICYETVKDKDGKGTPLLTEESMDREEVLDRKVHSLIEESLKNPNSNWKELKTRLDKISKKYCEEMFIQAVSDGFMQYTDQNGAYDKVDAMIVAFVKDHPTDATKLRGGWSVGVLDQYHQKMFSVLHKHTNAVKTSGFSAKDAEMTSFSTPVRIGDKTIPPKDFKPVETAAEAEM